MYGRVDGPYKDKNNYDFIHITLYNDDGSTKNRITKGYNAYLKEVAEGFHNYNFISKAERRLRYFNKVREDYNLPLVTEDNKEQFYYPNTYEIEKLPGYYYIPFEGSIYATNKQGIIINLSTNKIIKVLKNRGYYYNKLYSYKSSKKFIRILQHRILALLFICKPDRHINKSYDELQVNHIDGIKINNKLYNLEWVTGIENYDHAVITGLNSYYDISKPVLSKNIITGEIKKYLSTGSCAKDFDIDTSILSRHLKSDNYGLVSVDNHIFKYDNNTPWPSKPPIVKNNRGYFRVTSYIVAKNIMTDEASIFNSIEDAIKKLELSTNSYYNHVRKYGKNIPYKNYLFFDLEEFKSTLKH